MSMVNVLYSRVFKWASIGALTTALGAAIVEGNGSLAKVLLENRIILVADLLVVLLIPRLISWWVCSIPVALARMLFIGYSLLLGLTLALLFNVMFCATIFYLLFAIAAGVYSLRLLLQFGEDEIPRTFFIITYVLVGGIVAAFATYLWYNELFYWIVNGLFFTYTATVLAVNLNAIRQAVRMSSSSDSFLVGAMMLNADMVNAFFRWAFWPFRKRKQDRMSSI